MKIVHFTIITVTVLLLVPMMMNNQAKAICMPNSDWPSAPCYGCPTCMPSKEKQREEWNPYYHYKGASWMEMMKTQMIEATKNGTLEDWVTGNQSNYNAWEYYYLNNQAPFFRSSVSGLNDQPHYIPPPLQQLKTGIDPKDVACKKGLQLFMKASDDSPTCVKPNTASKLVQRGWMLISISAQQNIPVLSNSLKISNANFTIDYNITGNGKILDIKQDEQSKALILSFETTSNGTLTVSIPRALLDMTKSVRGEGSFGVLTDGREANFTQTRITATDRIFSIPFTIGTHEIEIFVTQII